MPPGAIPLRNRECAAFLPPARVHPGRSIAIVIFQCVQQSVDVLCPGGIEFAGTLQGIRGRAQSGPVRNRPCRASNARRSCWETCAVGRDNCLQPRRGFHARSPPVPECERPDPGPASDWYMPAPQASPVFRRKGASEEKSSIAERSGFR